MNPEYLGINERKTASKKVRNISLEQSHGTTRDVLGVKSVSDQTAHSNSL